MKFFDRLAARAREIDSLLCVGLDPRIHLDSESELSEVVSQIVDANRRIIEASADYALAFKPNIAFYEAHGLQGLEALSITLGLIPDNIPIIIDAKRGDIGATAEAYAQGMFEAFGADAVTLSPYMGEDSVRPFLNYEDKGVFVLCRTSNPGSRDFQTRGLLNLRNLYQEVALKAQAWDTGRVGLVIGGNQTEVLREIRSVLPETWFLAPGIGTQGGDIESAILSGADSEGLGILPVVARGISQAKDPAAQAREYKEKINKAQDELRKSGSRRSMILAHNFRLEQAEGSLPRLPSEKPEDISEITLQGLLEADCFKLGEFKLKSGAISPFYIDLRLIISNPSLLKLVGRAYATLLQRPALRGIEFDRIAGIPAAGLPLATALSLETGIPMIFPRLEKKAHGTSRAVEGSYREGERVLLLDDLITSGTSKLEAIEVLRGQGMIVEHLLVLLERGKEGRHELDAAGVHLEALAGIKEFFPILEKAGRIDAAKRKELEIYAGHS